MAKNALIIFTRVPKPGQTKTRMMPYYSAEECAELHVCFLKDIAPRCRETGAVLYVYYTDGKPGCLTGIFGSDAVYREQCGGSIGERMCRAISDVLSEGHDKCVLTGTDIPELKRETVEEAFMRLDGCDIVLTATDEGGYCLIGMKEPCEEAFDVEGYGGSTVLEQTTEACRAAGRTVELTSDPDGGRYSDMDDREDIVGLRERMRSDAGLRSSETGRFVAAAASVSIIIPVYNEQTTIGEMLEQMRPYKDSTEIIFVDGGSTDGTVERIGSEFPCIVTEKSRAVQMNTGARASDGDVLFFLHCDSRIPDDIIGQIREVIKVYPYGCFGVRFPSGNLFMRTNERISNRRAWKKGMPFGDQGIFITRELFEEVGGYREIPIMEDYDLTIRLHDMGIQPGQTKSRLVTSARRYGDSTLSILRTEYDMWDLRRRFRRGEAPEKLAESYLEIR